MTMTYHKAPLIIRRDIAARLGELLGSSTVFYELHMLLLASIYLNPNYVRANPILSTGLLEFAALADVFLEVSPQETHSTNT